MVPSLVTSSPALASFRTMSKAYDSSSRTTASTQYSSTPRRSSVSGLRVSPGTMPHKIMAVDGRVKIASRLAGSNRRSILSVPDARRVLRAPRPLELQLPGRCQPPGGADRAGGGAGHAVAGRHRPCRPVRRRPALEGRGPDAHRGSPRRRPLPGVGHRGAGAGDPRRRAVAAPRAPWAEAERPAARREGQPRLARRVPRRTDAGRPPGPAGTRRHRLRGAVAARLPRPPGGGEAVPRLRARAGGGRAGRGARPPGRPVGLPQRRGAAPAAGRRPGGSARRRAGLGRPLPGWRLRGRAEPPPAAGRRLVGGPAGRAGGARRSAHGGDQRGALRRSGRPSAAGRAGLHPPRRHAGRGARAAPPQRRVPAQIGGRARAHRSRAAGRAQPDAPGRTAWRGQRPSAGRAGWTWTSSAIGSRASRSPRARRRSHTCTSLRTRAYGAVIGPLPRRRSSSWRTSWTSSSAPTWRSSS